MIVVFVKKVARFILFSVVILLILTVISHGVVKYFSDFGIDADATSIILGHSHPECAFDERLLPNFKNLAKGGEGYFYTYYKLKKVLEFNDQIETVYVEFSNTTVSEQMDQWIWGFEKMSAFFPVYSPFIDVDGFKLLYENNSTDFASVVSTSTRVNFFKMITGDLSIGDDDGAFLHLDKEFNPKVELDSPRKIEMQRNWSEDNLMSLDRIVHLCDEHNVKLVFVRSPQHKLFNISNEFMMIEIKMNRYPDILFLDFNNFPLNTNQFADKGHLNGKGATEFTKYFKTVISDKIIKE